MASSSSTYAAGLRIHGGRRHRTGHFCSASGCSNQAGNDKNNGIKRSYYTFPMKDPKRLKLWLNAIPRAGSWHPKDSTRICSDHFKGGAKTNSPGSVGYVPTIFSGADKIRGKTQPKPRTSRTAQKAADYIPPAPSKKAEKPCPVLPAGRPSNPKPAQDNVSNHKAVWAGTDHDYPKAKRVPSCATEVDALREENAALKEELAKAKRKNLSLANMKTDKDFAQWTNMPSRTVFMSLCSYLEGRGAATMKIWRGASTAQHTPFQELGMLNKPGPDRRLSVADELFYVLVRLSTAFTNKEVAWFCGLSESAFGQLFTSYVNFISIELKYLFEMPTVDTTEHVAACFQPYPNLRTVIDCTEVFVQKASNLQARKETYSNYKGTETLKFLVGMSPQLYVNYVSCAWGGRASDKTITLDADELLGGLPRGSSVMTDRGFSLSKELQEKGVTLLIPDFKGCGRSQMTRDELAHSETIAQARIHIERIIQRIRTFRILQPRAMLSMQDILEQIFVCCAYLTNFQTSIIQS